MTPRGFAAHVQAALGVPVRLVDAGAPVRTVGVVSGAGDELWAEAKAAACDAFVTGEMGHHHALDAREAGLTCVVGTHHATERVIVPGACRAPSRPHSPAWPCWRAKRIPSPFACCKPLCSAARQAAPGPQPARNEKSAAFAP